MKPAFYFHCRQCIQENLPARLEVFVDWQGLVWVWCKTHDREVFNTQIPVLDESQVRGMQCGHCGGTHTGG